MPSTSIIIPVFNQVDLTEQCLLSLFPTIPRDGSVEVVVVDNGSTDATSRLLKSFKAKVPLLSVVHFEINRGVSAACNAAAQAAKSDYLLFLKNEIVVQPGWLEPLLQSAARQHVGVVGSKILYAEDRTIFHSGYVYNLTLGGFYSIYHRFPENAPCVCVEREFQALCGACLLVKKPLFTEVGGFAEYGLEDIDLCLKLRQKNLKIWFNSKSVVLYSNSMVDSKSGSSAMELNEIGKSGSSANAEFCKHWPSDSLKEDDVRYYAEDGFSVTFSDSGKPNWKEKVSESALLFAKAKKALDDGDRFGGAQLLMGALKLYPRNLHALELFLQLLLEKGDRKTAARLLESYISIDPTHFASYLELARLYHALGKKEDTARIVNSASEFVELPEELWKELVFLLG